MNEIQTTLNNKFNIFVLKGQLLGCSETRIFLNKKLSPNKNFNNKRKIVWWCTIFYYILLFGIMKKFEPGEGTVLAFCVSIHARGYVVTFVRPPDVVDT